MPPRQYADRFAKKLLDLTDDDPEDARELQLREKRDSSLSGQSGGVGALTRLSVESRMAAAMSHSAAPPLPPHVSGSTAYSEDGRTTPRSTNTAPMNIPLPQPPVADPMVLAYQSMHVRSPSNMRSPPSIPARINEADDETSAEALMYANRDIPLQPLHSNDRTHADGDNPFVIVEENSRQSLYTPQDDTSAHRG